MDAAAPLKAWAGARVAVLSPTPTHPQDFGNRKRIFRICRRYVEEGARLTFIHYPVELEWREQVPFRAQREMNAAWHRSFTIAPTRRPHEDPAGTYHSIDEWWDGAIGDFLTWLFAVESFDIFIVNYSWLSKSLEYAPRSTFKILDTHDKFSGRKEMLESLGLRPEFFYTTDAQERIALGRADLVWAIKPEEANELQLLTDKPVLALQHLDPLETLPRPEHDAQGYLRVGVIGARNNVNRMNIGEFLREAEPIFRNAFAPVKIVIAGSVCDLLEDIDSPFVELMGPVGDVEDFYRSVDCVAIPMRRSTGLKIKTGEALSFGLPVLSLAHAFEGYEPVHNMHALTDFEEMAQALVELSFAPRAQLESLAAASLLAHKKTATAIARSFRRSDALALEKRKLVVIATDSRALAGGNIFELVLKSIFGPVRDTAGVAILIVRGDVRHVLDNPGVADSLRRVIVSADLPGARELSGSLAAIGVEVFDVAQYLATAQPAVVVADAPHPGLTANDLPGATILLRPDMIRLSDPGASLNIALHCYGRAIVSTPSLSRDLAGLCTATGAKFIPAPVLWSRGALRIRSAPINFGRKTVAILGSADTQAMAMTIDMARAWDLKPYIVATSPPAVQLEPKVPFVPPTAFFASIVEGRRTPPDFAVELDAVEPGVAFSREMIDRLRVPTVVTSAVGLHRSIPVENRPMYAATEHELWEAMRSLALDPPELREAAYRYDWADQQRERGWQELWRHCIGVPGSEEAELA
jgi:Glycosyl transferases group 1